MTSSSSENNHNKCLNIGDTVKWIEPLWAAPNKPRGKRDIVGEQEIIAEFVKKSDVLEFKVISITKLSGTDVSINVRPNDVIKRKLSSLEKGNFYILKNPQHAEIEK